ncbi:MAG: O-antigen ligase family protein [Actinomycetota bacterium]
MAAAIALLPLSMPIFPGNSSPVDIVIAGALLVFVFWAGTSGASLRAPYVVPVGLSVVTGTAAALLGQFPATGLQAIVQDLFLLGWALALANVARTPRALSIVARAWAWSSVLWSGVLLVAVMAGLTALAGVDPTEGSRAGLTFGDQNTAAAYYAISLMIVLACRRPRRGVARAAAVALIAIALFLTGSLAGLLGVVPGVAAVAVIRIRTQWGNEAAVASTIGVLLLAGLVVTVVHPLQAAESASTSKYIVVRDSIGRAQQSSSEREVLARETTRLFVTGGLLGRGPASTWSTLQADQAPYPKEAHDDYIAAIVERGVIGLFAVLLLVGAVTFRAVAVSTRPLDSQFREALPAPHWLLGVVPVFVVFSLTHEVLHDHTVWTFFGFLAAVYAWTRSGASGHARGELR